MKNLLQINASLFAAGGQSSKLGNAMVEAWRKAHPHGEVSVLDLAQNPMPHLTAERLQAFLTPAEQRTRTQRDIVAFSDSLIEQLRAADVIVLGLPMYNFGIPSTLKAYFDHVARAGITFRYTPNGPQGLLLDKKVYVFAARGGNYAGTPLDEGKRDAALTQALARIEALAA